MDHAVLAVNWQLIGHLGDFWVEENRGENGFFDCLVEKGKGERFWWDPSIFSLDPLKKKNPPVQGENGEQKGNYS